MSIEGYKHQVNKKRLIIALLLVPLVVIIVMLALLWGAAELIVPRLSHDTVGGFLSTAWYGLIACYPSMFLFALPTILFVERKRPSKREACKIYVVVAVLTTLLAQLIVYSVSLFFTHSLEDGLKYMAELITIQGGVFLAIAGCVAGLFTSFVMLWRRDDWR